MRKARRYLGGLLVVLLALGFAAVVRPAEAAQAVPACRPDFMSGRWFNSDPNTLWIVQLDIGFDAAIGQCTTRPRVSCGPGLCDWGEKVAIDVGDGWIQSVYIEPFVFRSLSVQLTHSDGVPLLRVSLYNDYADSDPREDLLVNEWMER